MSFPLFNTPIQFAHHWWALIIQKGDFCIDATAGNGHDTLKLAQLLHSGRLLSFDIQPQAISKSQERCQAFPWIEWKLASHQEWPAEILPESVKLIVYNLGYLPGGNHHLTTQSTSTLQSLTNALPLIIPGGAISITCYPGHPEGKNEETAISDWVAILDPKQWNVTHTCWKNRHQAPSFFLLQKKPFFLK